MNLIKNKILITGSQGFLGKHLYLYLKNLGENEIFCPSSKDYDLRKESDVEKLFNETKPDVVFSLAARVGGILDNKTYPADFYFDNILIGAYTYHFCQKFKIKKLINVGAGCGYPLSVSEPLKEEDIWNGFPQPESAPYSIAKKMLILQSIAYKQQYGLNSITCIPANIYGEFDNFHLEKSHVIPALVRKFYEAKNRGDKTLTVWGDGSAKRDFIYAGDVVRGMVEASLSYAGTMALNLASGRQYAIREVVNLLKNISNFEGEIIWDTTKPSGQSSREMSTDNLKKHLPNFHIDYDLERGLLATYKWFAENYKSSSLRL